MKKRTASEQGQKAKRCPSFPRYYRLLARFERDLPPLRLPFLGQAILMGHVDSLLEGRPVRVPRDFGTRWSDAEAGWKMACAVGNALQTSDADGVGVLDIADQLKGEADALALTLEKASNLDVRFRLLLEEYDNPSPALVAWATRDFADITATVIGLLKQNGVKITE